MCVCVSCLVCDQVSGGAVHEQRTGSVRFQDGSDRDVGTHGGDPPPALRHRLLRVRSPLARYDSKFTPSSITCTDFVRARATLERGFTPMFEYCSAQTQIVVGYEEDFLMLIAMRHNATGIASFPPLWPRSSIAGWSLPLRESQPLRESHTVSVDAHHQVGILSTQLSLRRPTRAAFPWSRRLKGASSTPQAW
jgi:hypothetical protein